MAEHDPVKMEIYLDDFREPLGVYRPPATIELDTTKMTDGPHKLLIRAFDQVGVMGIREVRFIVRNGPGIAVVGLKHDDIVEGKIPVLLNAYAGTHDENWEPTRAETPAPIPTWSWVLFLGVVAWAMYYWAVAWAPAPQYANSPTFSPPGVIASAAGGGAPGLAVAGAEGAAWTELGARVYEQRCQICHTASGEGIPEFVPSLRGSGIVLANDPGEHLQRILFGSSGVEPPRAGRRWRAWMPAFGELLSDQELAAVANHERTSWGNSARTLRPEQVRTAREEVRTRR